MYDIKEVSEQLKISQVAVYKQIKKKEVKSHVFKKDGKTFITQEGIDVINRLRSEFKQVENDVKNDNINNQENASVNNVLTDIIEVLKDQLKQKDDQIQQLLEQNKNSQFLLKNSQDRIIMLEDKSKDGVKTLNQKKGLFSWFKKKTN